MKYKKKPVVIEAMKFNRDRVSDTLCWASDNNIADKIKYNPETNEYEIPTLEGTMNISDGDVLIIGVQGEVYPCKPDIFEATYEIVSDGDSDANDYITSINQIDLSIPTGKLCLALLARLTTSIDSDKTPDESIEATLKTVKEMFE